MLVKVQRSDIPANDFAFNRMALRAIGRDMPFLATEQWLFGTDNPNMVGARGVQMARQVRVTITAGGTGYVTAPTVTFSDGSRGVAILDGSGGVRLINMTYVAPGTTAPTMTLTGGGGSGATWTIARGTAPTMSSNFMSTAVTSVLGNAIISNIQIAAAQTAVFVVKRVAAGVAQLISGARQTSVSPVDGDNVWHASTSDAYFAQSSPESAAQNIGTSPAAEGDWIALSVSLDGNPGTRVASIGDSVTSSKADVPHVASASSSCIPIGNARHGNFTGGVAVDIAAMVVFPSATTAAEQVAHLVKLRERLAARGITVAA